MRDLTTLDAGKSAHVSLQVDRAVSWWMESSYVWFKQRRGQFDGARLSGDEWSIIWQNQTPLTSEYTALNITICHVCGFYTKVCVCVCV